MIGAAIGIVFGIGEALLLIKLVKAVSSGTKIPIWIAVLQPLLIMIGLLLCAFIAKNDLAWAGIAMAASLILVAVIEFLLLKKKRKTDTRDAD